MNYPNLIVIGAMKAGTSTLHDYLSLHPDIYASKVKELDYFLWNYSKGEDWYTSNFKDNKKYRLESSPNYTKFFKDWVYAAKKMHKDIPHCKLIYLIRNPTERTLSECRHIEINPNKTIPKLLSSDPENELLTNSKYHIHIKEYLKYFNNEQLLILKMESLIFKPDNVLEEVASFLNITNFTSQVKIHSNNSFGNNQPTKTAIKLNENPLFFKLKKKIKSKLIKRLYKKIFYKRKNIFNASQKTKKLLDEYFEKDINQLERITNMSFEEWKRK